LKDEDEDDDDKILNTCILCT